MVFVSSIMAQTSKAAHHLRVRLPRPLPEPLRVPVQILDQLGTALGPDGATVSGSR